MYYFIKLLLLLFFISHPFFAFSGEQQGLVTEIIVRESDGLHYFHLEGVHNNKPPCAKNHDYWMIRNEKSPAGQSQLSILLTAQAQQKPIHVVGFDTCSRWPDGEDVNYLVIR